MEFFCDMLKILATPVLELFPHERTERVCVRRRNDSELSVEASSAQCHGFMSLTRWNYKPSWLAEKSIVRFAGGFIAGRDQLQGRAYYFWVHDRALR